ncbi:MAG: polyprenol monophosphomannose synthase [Candidatus Buchananbacteria bacterium]|nr:polyprenol monophosphomannose synthase [Candidatus Buchananbacteria bacterium]
MKDILLLPTYNEKENIKSIISEVFSLVPNLEILVIDDNSPDGTAKEVEVMMSVYPGLKILKRKGKTGLGNAYKEAMLLVSQDNDIRSVITMDADGSHQPKYLPDFLASINDYDLIIGSRYVSGGGVENWEGWRRYLSRFSNIYAKLFTHLPINDLTAGFMCIKTDFLRRLDFSQISSSGYCFLIELKFNLIRNLNARVIELPIIFIERSKGASKFSLKIAWESFWKVISLGFKNSIHADKK